jgi:ABC-type glycerol-3-phosphate transport system substrate-binding protein
LVEFLVYPQAELPDKIEAALEVGQPPDFAFGFWLNSYAPQWAFDDRLVDVSDAIGHFSDLFDPDVLSAAVWLNSNTRQKALYGLPMGRATTHVHGKDDPWDPRLRIHAPRGRCRSNTGSVTLLREWS